MANATIYDLTQETSLNAADRLIVQQTGASTRATSATFALMGGLVYSASSVTTANVTATVGTIHALDLSGLTADRNFVLPDSAQVGERIGVFVTTGDASFELDIVTAATGSLINGANAGGGTSWSRLFITNECCVFRCVNAGGAGDTDWIVEYDGRIPCHCLLEGTANQSVSGGSWADYNFGASDDTFDTGDLYDATLNSNNGGFRLRRAGRYVFGGHGDYGVTSDGAQVGTSIKKNGTQEAGDQRLVLAAGAAANARQAIRWARDCAAGDNFGFMVFNSGSSVTMNVYVACQEVLSR